MSPSAMNTNHIAEQEVVTLRQRKASLLTTIAALKTKKLNLSELPAVQDAARVKERLEQELQLLDKTLLRQQEQLRCTASFASEKQRLAERRERLKKLIELDAPTNIIAVEQHLIQQSLASPAGQLENLKQQHAEARRPLCDAIASAKQVIWATKRQLNEELDRAEMELQQITAVLASLAESEPASRPAARAIPPTSVPPTICSRRRRKRTSEQSPVSGPSLSDCLPKQWSFDIIVGSLQRLHRLPDTPAQAATALQELLLADGYEVRTRTILTKLKWVTSLTPAERQTLPRVVFPESGFQNWKIVRCGKFRLLLTIDESQRVISCKIRDRRDAYRPM